ncbi:hypothetical protein K8I28_01370 [bacterium]|nr:hypothetical protein [bacterium]
MKMRSFVSTIVTVVSFLLLQQSAFSQINRENIDDAFKEMEDEKLTLYFFNALDGESIENAKVTVEGSGSFSSDANGRVFFTPPPDGVHKVHFHKTGFEAATFEIEIMVGSIFFNRFSVSPALPIGNVRIVLDWDKSPRDLDAHFVKAGTYHISYRNMRVSSDGNANLDRDDVDSYGPETITCKRVDSDATYHYFVHNYSDRNENGSNKLSHSKATVKLFGGGEGLLEITTIPEDSEGVYWHVFDIVKGEVVVVNRVLREAP